MTVLRHPALLFDLDGTLIDSAATIRGGLAAALAALGLPARSEAELSACIGIPIRQVWLQLGIPEERHDEAADGYRAWAGAPGREVVKPFPGIERLLTALHAAGCQLVLATAKDPQAAGRALERHRWQHLFAGHAGAEAGDGPHKRAVVARALQRLPAPLRRQAAMVGDMPQDGDAARANGLPFIACAWGCGTPAALAGEHPAFTAANVDALAAWLGSPHA